MKESRYNVWVERGDAAYVFNGVSGALLRVAKTDYDAVRRYLAEGRGSCEPEVLAHLAAGLMLIPDDADELAFLGRRYAAGRHDLSRFALTIVTSLGCNFDCPYCFEEKHPSILDDEVQRLVLQVLDDQLTRIRSFGVTWYGGEPLIGKKALLALSDAFIDRCKAAEVAYNAQIITNGYLLDEKTCVELRDRQVTQAQVTLDGPPETHNQMRPLANGKETFSRIITNLHHAVKYLQISIRMNLDMQNFASVEPLLQILADEGLVGKLSIYPGHIIGINTGASSPSTTYRRRCFTNPAFAQAELQFSELAANYGFPRRSLPAPSGAPCTAVRANELVVGSKGELYKCWESVGNQLETIGHIRDYQNLNGRLHKWLKYDPFADTECRSCVALPVCMGGCAQHAMDPLQHENRCGTFRHTYREQVLAFVEAADSSPAN
jgi:uncharacterized protein